MKTGILQTLLKVESLAAILLLATVVFIIAFHCARREFSINRQSVDWGSEVSDDRKSGGSSFAEDRSDENDLKFFYRTEDSGGEAYAIFLLVPQAEGRPRDLDWFEDVKIKAYVEGSEPQQFLLLLRERVEHLLVEDDYSSRKYNEAYFELTNQPQTITIPRESFQVPRWWVAQRAVMPEDSSPTFRNFEWIELAVCYPNKASSGTVVIQEISFTGPIIPPVDFYRGLFGIWFLLAVPLCIRFVTNAKKARAIRRVRLNQVAQLEAKTDEFQCAERVSFSDTVEIQRYDELTSLLTAFGIRDAIDEAIQAVRNGDDRANIILFDVDDMDLLNETKGNSVGDALLRQIAEITSRTLPESHSVARWSGDKFLIVCHGQNRAESKDLACQLKKLIETETSSTCSFGVHQLNPINSFEEAFERASSCVREAKFNGKNKVVMLNLRMPTIATLASDVTQLPLGQPFQSADSLS